MNKREILNFYENLIQNNFLPYWSKFVDSEYGGLLNCINNYGDKLVSDDKFTWSQGRWLWILGRIYALKQKGILQAIDEETLKNWMNGTWDFIEKYSIYDDSICCYILTRDGTKKKDAATGRYDASIYADCFALIGMSQYVKVMNDTEKFPTVEKLYISIRRRFDDGTYSTEPYPIPEGMDTHAIPMIIINTFYEYIMAKRALGISADEEIEYTKQKLDFVLNDLYHENGYILEYKWQDGRPLGDTILERHIYPGHMLEDVWFQIEFLENFGGLSDYLPKMKKIVKTSCELGWDEQYGGLLRYIDREGGAPCGESFGGAYEDLIKATWDMKIWWPHTEILYTTLKMYDITGDELFKKYYDKSFKYIFDTFPNKELGEWTQIRNRDGSPEEKLVALPVKDPFHIMRSFIKIVEMCL